MGGGFLYLTAPAEDFVPQRLTGRLACGVLVTYAGAEAPARELIRSLLSLGPAGELIAELPYAELQCLLDDPPGYRNYWSAETLDSLPDQALDLFCARAEQMITPSPSQQYLLPQGGAMAREPGDYPVPWRTAPWSVHPYGVWADPADDAYGRRWVHDVRSDVAPWSSGAVYLNFIGDEGPERTTAGLGRANHDRLAAVKRQFDPENVFHLNHNIRP